MAFIKNFIICAGFILVVLSVHSSVLAQDKRQKQKPIGHVASVEGQAYVIGAGNPLKLRPNDPIYMNAKVETRDNSRLAIIFIDDSQIRLGSNASLKIDEYVYDPYPKASTTPQPNKANYSIVRGAFQYISGLLAKPYDSEVTVKTEKGSIGIRGTNFWAGPIDAGYGVYVLEGAVEFQARPGSGSGQRSTFLESNQGLLITDLNKPLGQAEKWQDFQIEKALEKIEFMTQSREQLLQRIRVHQERNIKSRQELWRSLHPRLPVPWATGQGDEFFSDDMNDQERRHRERMKTHDDRIQGR